MLRFLLVFWGCLSILSACTEANLPPGVVATVNGEAITLRRVEALYDTTGAGLIVAQSPSVELLRRQYGAALTTLVAETLIRQELDRAGLSISDEDVRQAEAEIRSNYPEGGLEDFLREEYIDPESWRELLRQRLSVQRFQEKILRLRIRISADEVRSYYEKHKEEFVRPRRVALQVIMGVEKEEAEKARAALAEGKEPVETSTLYMQTLRLPYDRLPPQWQKDLKNTPPGKPTPVRELDGLFQCLVLVEDIEACQLSVVEAYRAIEAVLVEEKQEAVFDEWLSETLSKAKIQFAASLAVEAGAEQKASPL